MVINENYFLKYHHEIDIVFAPPREGKETKQKFPFKTLLDDHRKRHHNHQIAHATLQSPK